MANQQQVDLLKQEVATAWNMWREEHPDTAIELNGADLSKADLSEARLYWALLEGALLTPEQLSQARVESNSL